jgi:hypothetical protein
MAEKNDVKCQLFAFPSFQNPGSFLPRFPLASKQQKTND